MVHGAWLTSLKNRHRSAARCGEMRRAIEEVYAKYVNVNRYFSLCRLFADSTPRICRSLINLLLTWLLLCSGHKCASTRRILRHEGQPPAQAAPPVSRRPCCSHQHHQHHQHSQQQHYTHWARLHFIGSCPYSSLSRESVYSFWSGGLLHTGSSAVYSNSKAKQRECSYSTKKKKKKKSKM